MALDWRSDKNLIPDLDYVQDHVAHAAEHVARYYRSRVEHSLRHFPVESPIEAAFRAWWIALLYTGEIHEREFSLRRQRVVETCGQSYRLDFAIEADGALEARAKDAGVALPRIAIELDGHDFHERTKQQVTERNERDRNLVSAGWTVLHFSGSELQADPPACVLDAYGHAFIAFWSVERVIDDYELSRRTTERITV